MQPIQSEQKALLKKKVLIYVLKTWMEVLDLTFSGRAFHILGPATLKDLSVTFLFVVNGVTSLSHSRNLTKYQTGLLCKRSVR